MMDLLASLLGYLVMVVSAVILARDAVDYFLSRYH